MISIKGLHKFFNKGKNNEIHVINDINLELEDHGMTAIFGKSGCGKTTLLNVIGGLDSFAEGAISIDGNSIAKGTDDVRNAYIGYIFQNYNLNTSETCYENVADALRLCGMRDEEEIERRVIAALSAVDMERYKKRTPDTLSGGQMQRIAIARAIVKNPRIILADEPTGNLDEANTVMIMDLLKAISKEHLVLLVTHEANLVDYYCDTVIELSDGRVENVRKNASAMGYSARSKNDIWLGELQHETVEVGGAKIDLFGNVPETPISLRIVNSGGKLYLEVNTDKVQILDPSSEVKLREGSYEEAAKRDGEEKSIDMSALPSLKGEKFGKLFSFSSSVKSGYRDGYKSKKRGGKLLRRVMTLFAAVMVFMSAVFGGSIGDVIKAKRSYNHNVFYVYTDEQISAKLNAAAKDPATGIDYLRLYAHVPTGDEEIAFSAPVFESFNAGYDADTFWIHAVFFGTELIGDAALIAGSMQTVNPSDIIITKKVADDIIESSSLGYIEEYSDLIGLISPIFKVDGRFPSVSAVIDSEESAVYVSDIALAKQLSGALPLSRTSLGSESGVQINDGEAILVIRTRNESVEYPSIGDEVSIQGKLFTVTDVREHSFDYFEYLTKRGIKKYDNAWDYLTEVYNETCEPVEKENYDALSEFIASHYCDFFDYYYSEFDAFLETYYYFEPGDSNLWLYNEKGVKAVKYVYAPHGMEYYTAMLFKEANGRYPTQDELYNMEHANPHEDMQKFWQLYEQEYYSTEHYYNFVDNSYMVSDADFVALSKQMGETHASAKQGFWYDSDYYYGAGSCYTIIHSSDPAATSAWLDSNLNIDTGNEYLPAIVSPDDIFALVLAENRESIITGIVTMCVMIVLLSVCMYFIMRSALMNRIKEVGIYRAIGVSKKNLTFRFFIESAVLTVLTVLVGFLLTSAFIYGCLSLSQLVESVLYYPIWMAGAILALLIFISLFFGTLPIRSLLRKTPSEILAKYDI